ncbi:MAG: hypothetical protein MI725_02755 [Pirellulales bacterium]|nr:hypothetical protein [Pirellulales bacterium]
MQTDPFMQRSGITFRLMLALSLLTMFGLCSARANVTGEGDVTPEGPTDLPIGGGTASTPTVIVGDTSIGELTIDSPSFTDPLESTDGIIGNNPTGIGQAKIDGFDVDQSAWILSNDLWVGNKGLAFLDVTGGGSVEVGHETIVGVEDTSYGEITINGVFSRLVTDNLTVGEDGVGVLKVLNRGSLWSGNNSMIGDFDEGNGTVQISGAGSRWFVGDTATTATAVRLTIDDGGAKAALLQVDDQALVQSSGSILVNAKGRIELGGQRNNAFVNGGSLRLLRPDATLTNNGLIKGDGFIDATVANSADGVISNRAAGADIREHLRIDGAVTNDGTIDSFGGEMTFESAVTNNLELFARDSIMTFNAGLTNDSAGSVTLGGNTTLHAPGGPPGGITFMAGELQVLSDSASAIVGDITFTGSAALSLTVGPAAGTLDVTGMANLSGADINLNYSAGVAAQPGDAYQIFQAGGGITGAFPTAATAGGLTWIIDRLGTTDTLFASAIGVSPTIDADFNDDGIVDATDQAIWRTHYGSTGAVPLQGHADGDGDVDGADFLKSQRDFGGPPTFLVAVATAVPEPSAVFLALIGWCSCCRRLRIDHRLEN